MVLESVWCFLAVKMWGEDGESEQSTSFWERDVVCHVVPEKDRAGGTVPAGNMG